VTPCSERFEMVLPRWLKESIKKCAERKGVGMSEWVKDALKEAVAQESTPKRSGTRKH